MSKSAHALVFCRLFFIHNFPCQLGRGHSLFIYFYARKTQGRNYSKTKGCNYRFFKVCIQLDTGLQLVRHKEATS